MHVGETLQWQCRLKSLAKQKLKITLHIHFLKANGKHSPKAFIVADASFDQGQETDICKRHHFKPITTRSLYPGRHFAELVINGVSVARKSFELVA